MACPPKFSRKQKDPPLRSTPNKEKETLKKAGKSLKIL